MLEVDSSHINSILVEDSSFFCLFITIFTANYVTMSRIKKIYVLLVVLSLVLFIFLFFLSSITKNYLVTHSEKLVGRKLDVGEMHFNYAKVAVQVKNLVLYEANQTDSFISFSELYINFNPWALIKSEYSFSEIRLANPLIQIIQDGDKFNFDSLIPKEDSADVKDTLVNEALKFTIRNIQLIDGKVKYVDVPKNNVVQMKNLSLNLPLLAWNNAKSDMGIDFTIGEKGHVVVQAIVDNLKNNYQIDVSTSDIQIQPISNYVTDYFNLKSVTGLLASRMKIVGDMNDLLNIQVSGEGSVSDLSVLDSNSEVIIASSKVTTTIKDVNLKTNHYGFGKIEVNNPSLLLIRDTKMTNIERFILPYFRSDSISSASGIVAADEVPLTYSIDTIKVTNGLLSFSDRTLNRPFSYEFRNLNLMMKDFSESADQIPLDFSMKLNGNGEFSVLAVWSMLQPMNFQMEMKFKRLDLLSFSPYSEFYIASPITQGWFNYDMSLKMTPTTLDNMNKVKIDELEFGKRTKDTSAMKVPIRLGLYLMKDAKDEIKFDIPVAGNPSEPQFKLGKIIWKAFGSMMVKAVASPFRAMQGLAGANPESLEKLPFEIAQDSLTHEQREKLTNLALILKKKPELMLILTQTSDPEKEKNLIAIQLTKKDFIESQPTDTIANKMSIAEIKEDDPTLLAFVRKTVPDLDQIGFQKACIKRIAADRIEKRFQEVLTARNQAITNFFIEKEGIPSESVQVSIADLENLPQELRIPQFKIEVSLK